MPPKLSFCPPPNDVATFKDLLIFEQRLKTNAAKLQRRKAKYQLFLVQLLSVIAFLLVEVLTPPHVSILSTVYREILRWVCVVDEDVLLHPFIATSMLFVSVTTLVLFFASGLYGEKIAYANRYVPHANRALRSLNMFLNVRRPSIQSKLGWNPLSFFFPRDHVSSSSPARPESRPPSPSPPPRARSHSATRPIAPIPPSSNPMGELMLASRVDKNFRESYERYRSSAERYMQARRQEKEYSELQRTWYGRLMVWKRPPPPASPMPFDKTPIKPTAKSRSSTPSYGTLTRRNTYRPPRDSSSPLRDEDSSPSIQTPLLNDVPSL